MFDKIELSAAYAQALLLAILPLVSDFSERLDLDIPLPITTNQVARFSPSRDPDNIGGQIVLTNGFVFSFQHGHVQRFSSPRSYTLEQDPGNIPSYFGPIRLTKEQAIEVARQKLQRLGYDLESLYADLTPEVTSPPKVDGKNVARYRVTWFTPRYDNPPSSSVYAEVNATSGAIERLFLLSQSLYRPPPKIDVEPPIIKSRHRRVPLSSEEEREQLQKALTPADAPNL